MKKILGFFFKFGVAALILYYLYSTGKLNPEKLRFYASHSWFAGVFATIFAFVFMPLTSLRLIMITRIFDIHIRFRLLLALTWIGMFFNVTLPGAVTGDLIKGYYLKKNAPNISKRVIAGCLFLDRLAGLSGLILLSVCGVVLSFYFNESFFKENIRMNYLAAFVVFLFAGNLVFYGLYFSLSGPFCRFLKNKIGGRIGKKMLNLIEPILPRKGKSGLILLCIILSSVIQSFFLGTMIFIAEVLMPQTVPFIFQILVVPLGLIFTAIPISPGGLGVGHVAFESLYLAEGYSNGANVFNLYILLYIFCSLFGLIPYILQKKQTRKINAEE